MGEVLGQGAGGGAHHGVGLHGRQPVEQGRVQKSQAEGGGGVRGGGRLRLRGPDGDFLSGVGRFWRRDLEGLHAGQRQEAAAHRLGSAEAQVEVVQPAGAEQLLQEPHLLHPDGQLTRLPQPGGGQRRARHRAAPAERVGQGLVAVAHRRAAATVAQAEAGAGGGKEQRGGGPRGAAHLGHGGHEEEPAQPPWQTATADCVWRRLHGDPTGYMVPEQTEGPSCKETEKR